MKNKVILETLRNMHSDEPLQNDTALWTAKATVFVAISWVLKIPERPHCEINEMLGCYQCAT